MSVFQQTNHCTLIRSSLAKLCKEWLHQRTPSKKIPTPWLPIAHIFIKMRMFTKMTWWKYCRFESRNTSIKANCQRHIGRKADKRKTKLLCPNIGSNFIWGGRLYSCNLFNSMVRLVCFSVTVCVVTSKQHHHQTLHDLARLILIVPKGSPKNTKIWNWKMSPFHVDIWTK